MADLLPPFFAAFFCRAWNSLSLASNSLLSPLRIMPKKPDQLPASIHLYFHLYFDHSFLSALYLHKKLINMI